MGFIRIYVFIGSVIGFLLYRLTLGKLLTKIYSPIIKFILKTSGIIAFKIKKNTKKLLKKAYNILYNVSSKIIIFRNKLLKTTEDKRDIDFNEGKKA